MMWCPKLFLLLFPLIVVILVVLPSGHVTQFNKNVFASLGNYENNYVQPQYKKGYVTPSSNTIMEMHVNKPIKGTTAKTVNIKLSTNSSNTKEFNTDGNQHDVIRKHDTARFLLNIHRVGLGGANSQYVCTVKALAMAKLLNRTMVMTPFFLHGGLVRGYSIANMRQFNDTFDVKKLKEIVPLATMDEFKKKCNSGQIKVVSWTTYMYNRSNDKTYASKLELKLPDEKEVIQVGSVNADRFEDIVGHTQCLGVFQPKRLKLEMSNTEELLSEIRIHLKRSPVIRNVTDHLLSGFCGGKPYVAMHWRNMSAEMPCYFHHLDVQCARVKLELSTIIDNVTKAVADIIKEKKLTCLYVSYPEWSEEIIDHLSGVISRRHIYTWKDIVDNDDNEILNDFYFSSLVEQEICYRSEVFLAAGVSNWSDFVKSQRDLEGKTTFRLNKLPGVPEYSINNLI